MTKFGDWILAWNPTEPHKLWNVYGDLATLTAQLEEALEKIRSGEIPEAVKREGLFACLTYKETIAALALAACKEFQEKHE